MLLLISQVFIQQEKSYCCLLLGSATWENIVDLIDKECGEPRICYM